MKEEEIIEGNKLIAEFWGYKTYGQIQKLKKEETYLKDMYFIQNTPDGKFTVTHSYGVDSLKFNSDWNWLMPVVEKIDDIAITTIGGHKKNIDKQHQFSTVYGGSEFIFTKSKSKIEAVYFGVVQFIKWYKIMKTK